MKSKLKKPAKTKTSSDEPQSIGMATMSDDGTIRLLLRAQSPKGALGDAMLTYRKSDPKYASSLSHVGGLKPGEEKPVPPFD